MVTVAVMIYANKTLGSNITNYTYYIYKRILCEIQRLYNVVSHNCILFASTMPAEISKEKYIPIHNYDTHR